MNLVGVVVWYDEQPSMLAPAVAGFARVCDTIVAVDGGYALYPGARARSHPAQAETILRTCEAAGAGCVIHTPRDIWFGNEVEKRNMSLRLAAPLLTEGDWVVVFDSDFHVLQADVEAVRGALAETELLVATYTLMDGKDWAAEPDALLAELARARPVDTEWTFRTRSIFRWTPDLAYGPAHWQVCGTYDGVIRHVYGPDQVPGQGHLAENALQLGASLVAYHRRDERPLVRRKAAESYYQLRDQVGAEAAYAVA